MEWTNALGSRIFLSTSMTMPLRLARQPPTTVWERVSYSRGGEVAEERGGKERGKGEEKEEKGNQKECQDLQMIMSAQEETRQR